MNYEDKSPFVPRPYIGSFSLSEMAWTQPPSGKHGQRKRHTPFQSKNEMWIAIETGYGAIGDDSKIAYNGGGWYSNWEITKDPDGRYCVEACHEEDGFARAYYNTKEELERALIQGDNHEDSDHWEQPILAFGSSYWIHWQWGHK